MRVGGGPGVRRVPLGDGGLGHDGPAAQPGGGARLPAGAGVAGARTATRARGRGDGVSRARAAAVVAASLALHALLLAHGAPWLPGPLRLAAALAVLVLVPGWAFVRLGARPPGGAWLEAGWAFGLGVAWNAALVALPALAGRSFLPLLGWTPLTSVLPWALVIVRRGARGARAAGDGLPRAAALAVLLAALLVTVHAARLGPVDGLLGRRARPRRHAAAHAADGRDVPRRRVLPRRRPAGRRSAQGPLARRRGAAGAAGRPRPLHVLALARRPGGAPARAERGGPGRAVPRPDRRGPGRVAAAARLRGRPRAEPDPPRRVRVAPHRPAGAGRRDGGAGRPAPAHAREPAGGGGAGLRGGGRARLRRRPPRRRAGGARSRPAASGTAAPAPSCAVSPAPRWGWRRRACRTSSSARCTPTRRATSSTPSRRA